MSALFGRRARLRVGPVAGLEELAFSFNVKKTLKPDPNTCEIDIYNLSPATRTLLTSPLASSVTLDAGYGDDLSQIYSGEVRTLEPGEVNGADIVTRLASGDGEKKKATTRLNVPVGPGAKAGDVLSAIASALGVKPGNLPSFVSKLNASGAAVYPRATVITGNAAQRIDDLCRSANLEWSLQDGALQFLDLGQPLLTKPYVIASDSGMLGSPKQDADGRVSVECLILPHLRCGMRVQIESVNVNGLLRIAAMDIKGDTWGDDWQMSLTLDKPGLL